MKRLSEQVEQKRRCTAEETQLVGRRQLVSVRETQQVVASKIDRRTDKKAKKTVLLPSIAGVAQRFALSPDSKRVVGSIPGFRSFVCEVLPVHLR